MMVLFIILLILIFALIFVSARLFEKMFNPISIINLIFGIWLILGRIGLFGQFLPTVESSIFFELNLLLIDFFVIIGYNSKMRKKTKRKIRFNSEKFFKIFRVICFVFSVFIFINMIRGLISGEYSVTSIRDMSYSTRYGDDAYAKIYFNSFVYYFYQYVIRGFAFFDLTYNFGKLLRGGKKIPVISILNFILFILIMQSRIEFMKFAIFAVIFFLFSNIKLNKKQKRILKRSFLIIIVAALAVFSVRSITSDYGVVENTVSNYVVDFSGSNYMFSSFLDDYNDGFRIDDSPLILKYLGGLGLAIEHILTPFGFTFDHSSLNTFLILGHNIGSSDHYNAFYTMYFDFINSGGLLGCFLFSIILGFIIGRTYKRGRMSPSLKNIYIASFLTYVAVMGTYNYTLSGIGALVIVCCIIVANDDTVAEKSLNKIEGKLEQ